MSISRDSFKTLLPRNEPLKQKDLDYLGADVIERVGLEELTLLPSDAPLSLLKHLAYMYDVSIDGLSEKEQRKLIERSFEIHRHLGTPYALKEALKVIGVEAEIINWDTTDGELNPYYFGLKIESMDSRGTLFLLNYIESFKNIRSRLAKLSDGKCKSKAQYDAGRYDQSVLDNVEGVVLNGVRVCFKGNIDKENRFLYSSIVATEPFVAKTSYFFNSRFDAIRYGSTKSDITIGSSSDRTIVKIMTIRREWLGKWVGSVTDAYRPSFLSETKE